MSTSGIRPLDKSIHKVNEWVNQVHTELGDVDKLDAFRGLSATLHALRDRLPIEASAHLAAQLPLVLRGVFFDGWRPSEVPASLRSQEDFLKLVAEELPPGDLKTRPEDVARAAFKIVSQHISPGETDKVQHVLPPGVRELWPRH